MTDFAEFTAPMMAYTIAVAFIFGACMGSFLNCAAWRSVHGESFIKGRSHCTTCGHELGLMDLVPILSWTFAKGKCRYCGDKVSVRYPLTELVFGIITVVCLLRFGLSILCVRNYVFLCVLFVLTLTDIDDMIIPDGCHITAAATWLITAPFIYTDFKDAGAGLLAAILFGGGLLAISLLLDRITGRDTLGGGDIKLIAAVGLYLGMIGTMFTLIIACILGLLYSITVNKSAGESKAFPFGPWIAGAAALMLLFGTPLIEWYKNLLI